MSWEWLSQQTLDNDWESNYGDYLDDEGNFHDNMWDD